jgi:hypothetical protein
MRRKRVGGRCVRESETLALDGCEDPEISGPSETQSLRNKGIDRARRTLEEAIPEVAAKLAEQAKEGSVAHMKLLLQLLGLDDDGFVIAEARPQEKTLEQILLEEWQKQP